MRFHSFSSRATEHLGQKLAKKILRERLRTNAIVLALTGDLGSGKTTFARGFLRGLAPRARTASPTFVLIRRAPLRGKKFTQFFHVDAYRLKRPQELVRLGFKEILADPRHLVLIEWADKLKKLLPRNLVGIKFSHTQNKNKRIILLKRRGVG